MSSSPAVAFPESPKIGVPKRVGSFRGVHMHQASHDVLMTDLQQQPPTFEQAAYLLNRMDQQVQFADTKATFILGANSALVSYLFSTPLARDAGHIASLATALRMMCLLCLLYSSYHVLKVVRPRLVTFTDKGAPTSQMNYLFFEHIARVPLQEYVTRFQSIAQTEEMTDLLIAQVWANAQVATLKFHGVQAGIDYLLLGVLLLIASMHEVWFGVIPLNL